MFRLLVVIALLQEVVVAPGEWGGSGALDCSPGVIGVSRFGEHLLGDLGDIGDLGSAQKEPDRSERPPWPLLHDKLPREVLSSWQPFAGITVIMDSDESML